MFLLLTLELIYSSFPSFLVWKLKLSILDLSSFLINSQCYKFLSKHCFCCVPEVLISCVSIFFSSEYFKISLETSLNNVLLRNVLFNFHIFWDFLIVFLLLLSSLILWGLRETLYDFWSFTIVEVCFMAQNVVCLGKCSIGAWEECVFCCGWMQQFEMSVIASWSVVLLSSAVSWLSACWSCLYLREGSWSFQLR